MVQSVRQKLYDELTAINPDRDWSFILRQIGMFSYTGLTKPQVGLGFTGKPCERALHRRHCPQLCS